MESSKRQNPSIKKTDKRPGVKFKTKEKFDVQIEQKILKLDYTSSQRKNYVTQDDSRDLFDYYSSYKLHIAQPYFQLFEGNF
jgi:hypothetical protein